MAFRRKIFDKEGCFLNKFQSRGDDTSLYRIIIEKYKYMPVPEAEISHERPTSFWGWIRILWKEQGLSFDVDRAVFEKTKIKKAKKQYIKRWLKAFYLSFGTILLIFYTVLMGNTLGVLMLFPALWKYLQYYLWSRKLGMSSKECLFNEVVILFTHLFYVVQTFIELFRPVHEANLTMSTTGKIITKVEVY